MLPDMARERIRREAVPMFKQHKQLMKEMHDLYCQDQLDTVRFKQLVDTLSGMKGNIERAVLTDLMRLHPTLTPQQRERFYPAPMRPGPFKGKKEFYHRMQPMCPMNENGEDSLEPFPDYQVQ